MGAYCYVPTIERYGCPLILNQHNVEVIARKERFSANYSIQNRKLTINKKIEHFLHLSQIKSMERHLISKVHQIWMCSDTDDKLLQDVYGQVPHTRVVANGIDVAHYDGVRLGKCNLPEGLEKKQRNLLYLGLFSYAPNALAVELLINQIYPRLRGHLPRLPSAVGGG